MAIVLFQDIGVLPSTTDHQVLATEAGRTFTNEGAAGTVNLTMPDVQILGATFTFTVVASQPLNILANAGQSIRLGTASLGSISSSVPGSSVILTRLAANIWNAVAVNGNWNIASVAPAFPVGSIFLSTLSTNPATLLGYGTWVAFAAGRMMIGQGAAPFDVLGATGGAQTHTLSVAELATHHHVQAFTTNPTVGSEGSMGSDGPSDEGFVGDTADTGNSTPFSIMNPYIVIAAWLRTA